MGKTAGVNYIASRGGAQGIKFKQEFFLTSHTQNQRFNPELTQFALDYGMSFKFFLSSASIACLIAVSTQAAEPLSPRVEVGVKGGTDRSLLTTEFWAPLAQKSDRVLYGDIRLMGDNDENREGNLGLGYRQIHNDAVLGVHGWIDRRRTQNNSTFHQLTFGIERLGHVVDARANVYVPLNQSRNITTPNIGQASPYLAGTGIFYDTNGFISETPQYGLDGEVGYRIPVFQKHVDAIRVYGGGYHFFRDETQDVTGFRVRTEAQVNSAFSVGARFQHDDPRGSQGFLEATIKFPFGAKKLYQTDYLRARLDESPERDIDIVTASKVDNGLGKQVINTTSGQAQRILYVDNTNAQAGDGSKDNPFNALKAAEAALKAHDILYVHRGTGTTTGMDQGIVIDKANIQMIGSGSELSYNGFTLLSAGLAPVITNSIIPANPNPSNSVDMFDSNGILVTADNISISGLEISNATRHGIFVINNAQNWQNVRLDNITANHNGTAGSGYGIAVRSMNGGNIDNITITNNTANSNTGAGIHIGTGDGAGKIQHATIDNNITNSNAHGISVSGYAAQAGIHTVSVTRNQALGNTANGLYVLAGGGSIFDQMNIEQNNFSGNIARGVYIFNNNALSEVRDMNIEDNIVSDNTTNGIHLQSTGLLSGTVHNNTVEDNDATGLFVQIQTAGSSNTVITQNRINNNGNTGISIAATGTATLTSSLSENTVTGNGQSTWYFGLDISTASPNAFQVDLGGGTLGSTGNNRIYGNDYRDIRTSIGSGVALNAQNNWWGNSAGLLAGRTLLAGGSTINSSGHLVNDPENPIISAP